MNCRGSLLLCLPLLLVAVSACSPSPAAPRPIEELFDCSEAIFRPTSSGASLHWFARQPLDVRVRWGDSRQALDAVIELACEGPTEVTLEGAVASRQVFFEVAARPQGSGAYTVRPVRSFSTKRDEHQPYRVGLLADTHINTIDRTLGASKNLSKTIERCLTDDLDFVIFLGDEAGVHAYGDTPETMNADVAFERWRLWRQTYTPLLEEIPGFFTLGNHEGESAYYQSLETPTGTLHLQRWGTAARKQFLLNPLPDTYPEGGENQGFVEPNAPADEGPFRNRSPLQNYFAWTWGSALFVVLDVQRYTQGVPQESGPGGESWEVKLDVEDWTLGVDQLAWFERTLEQSDAKHKIVLAHHVVGGWGYDLKGINPDADYKYGRGGARYAMRGEQARITEIMKRCGARYFFYGHDHVFAHQEAEEVEFICCGRPSFLQPSWWSTPGWKEAYGKLESKSAQEFLAAPGYTRLSISPDRLRIEYVQTAAKRGGSGYAELSSDGVIYRWDNSMPSPTVDLVR